MRARAGVEITADAIKYVVLERGLGLGQRPRVRAHGRVPLSDGLRPEQVLMRLRSEGELPERGLRVAIGTQATQLRVATFPPMPKRELALVARAEIEKDLEMMTEEMAHGWQRLAGPSAKRGLEPAARSAVLLAFTPRHAIDTAAGWLRSAGFAAAPITTSSLALFEHARTRKDLGTDESCVAILHIGLDRMMLALVEDGTFRLLRDLSVGLDASWLSLAGEAKAGDSTDLDWDAIDQLSRGLDAMTQVAQQIRRTLEYDAKLHPDRPVTRVLLAGDATRAQSMVPLLSNELALDVALLDPLAGLSLSDLDPGLAAEAPSLALAFALARSGDELLDLRPEARLRRAAPPDWRAVAGIAGAFVVILSGAAVPLDARLAQLREEARTLEAARAEARLALGADVQASTTAEIADWLATAVANSSPREVLDFVSRRLPQEVRVTRFRTSREGSGQRVSLEAMASADDAPSRVRIWSEIVNQLSADPRVRGLASEPPAGARLSSEESPFEITFLLEAAP